MKALIGQILILISVGQALGQKSDSVTLLEFKQSTCDSKSDPYRLKPRIISLYHHADTLALEIGFATTCCLEYLPIIKFTTDTLYLSYGIKDEGEACSCICCYSFYHKISGVKSKTFSVKLYDQVIELSTEKYWTYEPTFKIVKGDTVDRKDKYGLKQGIWVTSEDSFQYYVDDKLRKWGKVSRQFYDNGKLRQECYKTKDGELLNCRQWKRNGQEIK